MTDFDREQHDHFLRLFMEHEETLHVSVWSSLFSHDEEREVMQEVAAVLWRKFEPDMDSLAFCRWAFGVARMEALAFRRHRARDRHTFWEEVSESLGQIVLEQGDSLEAPRTRRPRQSSLAKRRTARQAAGGREGTPRFARTSQNFRPQLTKAGMSSFSLPSPYDTQAPMLGLPMRMLPVFI